MSYTHELTLNEVKLTGKNRRIIVNRKINPETIAADEGKNIIYFKALTSEVGLEQATTHKLSANNKIKETTIGLSDEALLELYATLHIHFATLKDRDEKLAKFAKEKLGQKE